MVCIVTLKVINEAIVQQLIEGLMDTEYKVDIDPEKDAKGKLIPNGVIISSTDIVEGIIRPSFYINFLNNKTNLMLQNARERNLEIELFYFAQNRKNTKIEVLEMQDLLSKIFITSLKITEDFYVSIHGCEFDVNKKDGYLILNLELYILEELDEEGTEMLEELDTSIKIN